MSTMSMQYHGLDANTYCPHCGELVPPRLVTLSSPPPLVPSSYNPAVHYCDHDLEYCNQHQGGPGCNMYMSGAIPAPGISTFERKCTKCGEEYDADAFCSSCRSERKCTKCGEEYDADAFCLLCRLDQLLIEEENKKIKKDVENSTALENFILEYDKKNG